MSKKLEFSEITEENITTEWCSGNITSSQQDMILGRLKDILTGEYDLEEAREDVLSFKEAREDVLSFKKVINEDKE